MRSTRVRATILELESEIGSFFIVNNRVERANFCSFHIFSSLGRCKSPLEK